MKTPKLIELIKFSKNCEEEYSRVRKNLDNQRFFSIIRVNTHNPERLMDTKIIVNLGTIIADKKFDYSKFDKTFQDKRYDNEVAPFLSRVLSGVLFHELSKITESYSFKSRVKQNSALGKIILDLFEVNSLSDIKSEYLEQCQKDLSKFIKVMDINPELRGDNMTDDQMKMLKSYNINDIEACDEEKKEEENNEGLAIQNK